VFQRDLWDPEHTNITPLKAQPGSVGMGDYLRTPAVRPLQRHEGSGVARPLLAILLTSCPDSEERTGIWFEKERVCGYHGGAKARPGNPFAPAIAPIRGSRR
jgi:hypothetical protein